MKRICIAPLLAMSLFLILSACTRAKNQDNDPWPAVTNETKPWSRWWWLGSDVDRANIEQLMEEYGKAGLGGLEITPIYGVQGREPYYIDFLSSKWMEMLEACVESAALHGMGIDMNLGTGWPFGGPQITPDAAAGKLVLQQYTFTRPERLPHYIVPEDPVQARLGATLEALMAWSEDGTMVDLTSRVGPGGELDWNPGPGTWQLVAAFSGKTGQQVKRAAPGGRGPTMDHLSAKALQVYLSRFDSAFSNTPGLFTAAETAGSVENSEMVRCFFNDSYEVYGATWTPGFFDAFKSNRGYDLRAFLREFSGYIEPDGDDVLARLKSDYRETMSELLMEQFTIPWTQWSHQHGSLTRSQAHGSPGNLIDLYAAVDIPECEIFGHRTFDIPGMRLNEDDSRNVEPNPMMLKLATSAAHITNKPLISNETFTWLGEHFKVALSQCKPEVEEAFLAGINHVFYHGIPYSPAEAEWPGWLFYASVHFGTSNSWWPHLQGLNSYITRCQSILQSGRADNEALVYWPVYDLWHDAQGMEKMLTVHNIEEWLVYPGIEKMVRQGYSYDFISDRLIEKLKTREGMLLSSGEQVQHRVLVVPECRFMPLSTLQKIVALAEEGGVVIFEKLPEDVPGLFELENRREEFNRILASLAFTEAGAGIGEFRTGKGTILLSRELGEALAFTGITAEEITETGLKFTRRSAENGHYYYLVNHTASTIDAMVPLRSGGRHVLIMDPQDGTYGKAQKVNENGETRVRIQLHPGRSLFLRTSDRNSFRSAPWPYEKQRLEPVEIAGEWQLTFPSGEPALSGPVKMSVPGPYTELDDSAMNAYSGLASYEVTFTFTPAKATDYILHLGKVFESAKVTLNGTELDLLWSIPFEARVGTLLKEGENHLEIEVANLMANRIRSMDRAGIPWRIFHEINFVNIDYQPFDASGWEPETSGLAGPVVLIPVEYE